MSLQPEDIERSIAARFGQLSPGAEPFSASYLGPFLEKVRLFEIEYKQKDEKELQEHLAKRKKNDMVCPNPQCRNEDEEYFEKDERMAQVTCKRCGTVVSERQIADKEWVRRFEEEDNPSFHGQPPDPKFSSARNLQTGVAKLPGRKTEDYELALAKRQVELNLSSMMSTTKERKTRVGYKDDDKEKVFAIMEDIGGAAQVHSKVIEHAKMIFAKYRDNVEQLTNRYEIAAACMIVAFRDKLAEEGEAKVIASGSVPVVDKDAEAALEFKCKYCGLTFGIKRDKVFHQKKCDKRPKEEATTSGDLDGNAAKKRRLS